MPRTTLLAIGAALLLVVGLSLSFIYKGAAPQATPAIHETIGYTEGVQSWYSSRTPVFSFRLPDGFSAPNQSTPDGGEQIVVTDRKGNDATVVVIPIVEGANLPLTEAIVRANTDAQVAQFKTDALVEGTSGLRFLTDAAVWEGDGVAFWFIHNGYLYELTTARKNAILLDLLMQTFSFPEA